MTKERGKEWEHVKVLSKKGQSFQVQCNYCDKQFWIGSGQLIKRLSACTFVSRSEK